MDGRASHRAERAGLQHRALVTGFKYSIHRQASINNTCFKILSGSSISTSTLLLSLPLLMCMWWSTYFGYQTYCFIQPLLMECALTNPFIQPGIEVGYNTIRIPYIPLSPHHLFIYLNKYNYMPSPLPYGRATKVPLPRNLGRVPLLMSRACLRTLKVKKERLMTLCSLWMDDLL